MMFCGQAVAMCRQKWGKDMSRFRSISILSIVLAISASNCLTQNKPIAPQAVSPVESPDTSQEVFVSSGDLLTVSVTGAPEYRYDVRVNAYGDASLPMVGNIKLAGLSTYQAENKIAQNLERRGFFNEPQVSVFVKEYATSGIAVLGEVQKPGIYPLPGHRTLLDAISAAGGMGPRAGKTVSIIHRDQPDSPETLQLVRGDEETMTNRTINPGDTIVVSKAGMVYVVGDVKEPTGIIMDNPHLTILQAVAMAHGTNSTAALGSAKLIRKASTSPEEIPIPLNAILTAKAPDLELQPDDIVFVPNSVAKSVTRRSLEAILQTATGLAIYRPY
jgi:polysaccharide export outer membrane protein